ncbi:hypothetical protein Tco_0885586 [Tanacetum coccineum]
MKVDEMSLLPVLYKHYLTVEIGGENRRVAQRQDGDHTMTSFNTSNIKELDGMLRMDACYLELKVPSRSRRDGADNPDATKKKLAARGCFFQEGYVMQHLPVISSRKVM